MEGKGGAGSGDFSGSFVCGASTIVGATYDVSTSLAVALLLARLDTGVTWPATSKQAFISDASDSKASLFAAGFDSKILLRSGIWLPLQDRLFAERLRIILAIA